MRSYYRIMLGAKSIHADECYKGNFIGADFDIKQDLTGKLPDNWRDFNATFIPIYLENHPSKSRVSAGLSCGALWTVSKGVNVGDIVLCPNGSGSYYIGEVLDSYSYHADQILPHRRTVKWYSTLLERSAMSDQLKNSTGSIGTVSDITKYAEEIERLISGNRPPSLISTDQTVEDPAIFALEKHLEDFLVQNWRQTELGKNYDIYEEDGRVSDSVVGQIQRYMGYVQEELAEEGQKVKGVIIALEDDLRIKRALAVTNNIDFYKYQVSFRLFKG